MDSGATIHISQDATDFTSLQPIQNKPICGVGNSPIVATGVGTICLHTGDGCFLDLKDMLYVPKSTVKVISVSKLTNIFGITTLFTNTKATLTAKSNGKLIATGFLISSCNLYALNTAVDSVLAIHASPDLKTWHLRLGHANYQSIIQMACAKMVKNMPSSFPKKPPICDHCILGKQARTPVPKEREEGEEHKTTTQLEKVWVDLAEQTAVTSHMGNNYIINIVDNYTGKPWSITLKVKDNAFNKLKAWIIACKKTRPEYVLRY